MNIVKFLRTAFFYRTSLMAASTSKTNIFFKLLLNQSKINFAHTVKELKVLIKVEWGIFLSPERNREMTMQFFLLAYMQILKVIIVTECSIVTFADIFLSQSKMLLPIKK